MRTQPSLAEAWDPQELDELFHAHQDRIYGLCYRMVGDPERAAELAQDAMLIAWSKIEEFEGRARFGTWLYAIARNVCCNAIRRRGELLSDDGVIEPGDPSLGVLARMRKKEREALITAATRALEPIEQEAIHLRYVEGIPQDRISVILGLESASGARGLLQRCRRRLNRELRARLAEMGHGSSFVRGTIQ